MPDPANPQNLNRFTYVRNNLLRFCDPTGHCTGDPYDPSNPDAACWEAYYQATGVLGADFTFLAGWDLSELNRLLAWLNAGIRFTGRWLSGEISFVLGVLDEYAETFGRERFAELIRHGVMAQTGGVFQYLVFHRERAGGPGGLPAGWWNTLGWIVLWDEMFDAKLLNKDYWRYPDFRKTRPIYWGMKSATSFWMRFGRITTTGTLKTPIAERSGIGPASIRWNRWLRSLPF